jgi:hypothetical protein
MPIGSQSLQFFTSTVYTSMVASTYKANIDADTAIMSNVGGALAVVPNNPAGLSVLVDPAFNLPQGGTTDPYLLNGAASAVTVTLTAPGSNSYYACIYWDYTTSSAGVIYGATGVSPTRVLPDLVYRIPLAFVLLTNGQVTVTASNISDARSWLPECPVLFGAGASISTNQTYNCNGATEVRIAVAITAAVTLTMTNLREGVRVNVTAVNTTGGALNFKLAATTPAGTAYSITSKVAGATTSFSTNMVTGGSSIAAGAGYMYFGTTDVESGSPSLITITA